MGGCRFHLHGTLTLFAYFLFDHPIERGLHLSLEIIFHSIHIRELRLFGRRGPRYGLCPYRHEAGARTPRPSTTFRSGCRACPRGRREGSWNAALGFKVGRAQRLGTACSRLSRVHSCVSVGPAKTAPSRWASTNPMPRPMRSFDSINVSTASSSRAFTCDNALGRTSVSLRRGRLPQASSPTTIGCVATFRCMAGSAWRK